MTWRPPVAKRAALGVVRDIHNLSRFGRRALLTDELLYFDPQKIVHYHKYPKVRLPQYTNKRYSSVIFDGDWDLSLLKVTKYWKFRACHAHFVQGLRWDETETIDRHMKRIAARGVYDECTTREEVVKRLESIDRLYDSIAKDMRVTPVTELDSYRHRGYGGIFGHIDRHGDFIRTHDGNHRFAIARCLGLKLVPVHVGLVHPIAVRDGLIPFLRQQSLQLVNSGG